jgi:hypothetical protein
VTSSPLSSRTVAREKIVEYLLRPDHPLGGPKARFFRGFGFSLERWQQLAAALRNHPEQNPIEASISTPFGMKYLVRCNLGTPDRRDPCIVTVWLKEEAGPARLVTAYPAGEL